MLPRLRHALTSLYYSRCLHTRREDPLKRWPGWEVVVGIELHAQIKSRTKLFSEALTSDVGQAPNTRVSTFDAAFPGTLPRLNQKCVDLAVRTAIALNSNVQLSSSFDRKHYFYSDLPAGYQITQHYAPIALGGYLPLNEHVCVRIKQIQLEQDTAKSIVDSKAGATFIDLNRAGAGLMEIVSEPDMQSPEEAGSYVRALQRLLRAVGSCDGNMEQGSLRCDANVSVNRPGCPSGTRCEIKNLNSIKFMEAALTCEINRHIRILESSPSASVAQETRGFNEHTFETFALRTKEDAPDYRYMPDMNLGKIRLSPEYIERIRASMPELPDAARVRLQRQYTLSDKHVDALLLNDSTKEIPFDGEPSVTGAVAYFEQVAAKINDPHTACNWVTHELGGLLARRGPCQENTVSPEQLAELIKLVQDKVITRMSGRQLLGHMLDNPSPATTPTKLAHELDLIAMSYSSSSPRKSFDTDNVALSSEDGLRILCVAAVEALPSEVAAFRRGNKNVLNKLVGHVMRSSRGRADAVTVKTVLAEIISQ